ncbi:hypothetical protein [Paenibacillus elgii]|uniref:hypothetical protein n=1 Tax=Paenibacillus elgii TaxID=189691 RepID=UPI00158118BA|nr:hypothetical protein [Paenibacillus elgii]
MWNRIKKGWVIAWHQPFAVFALFFYNLLWGVVLYKLIQSVVLPLLHRYPGGALPGESVRLFWVEGQFQLMKTDLIVPYLWTGLGLIGLRMLLHPALNAGVFYSLRHGELNAGYRFVAGIRKLFFPFLGLYALQLVLSIGPLYWLVPYAAKQFAVHASYISLGQALLPALALYAAYLFLLQLLFLFLQIGKTDGRSSLYTLLFAFRHLPVIALAALAVAALSLVLAAAVMVSSFWWAGFAALVLMQAYRLVQMFFKVWEIGTQYALWAEKA